MKILDRFFDIFGKRRALLIGATTQPNDIMAQLYAVRARTYLKITGKALPTTSLPKTGAEDLTDSLSPSRRLLRKDF
ncbi:MAG: hypothetical protein RTV72_00175 [Candidatus Thorarchaeota archaeon]